MSETRVQPDHRPERPERPPKRRARPDPRPARLVMGASAVAAVTIIAAGLVDFPLASAQSEPAPATDRGAGAGRAERPVRYVRLRPGENAPTGATVIREAAPTPRVVVRRVDPPAAPASRPKVARTRQSGG